MKATDQRLILLAKEAGVRPPHIFHVWHTMRELGELFDPSACAQFASLELRFVERIVAVLTSRGLHPKAKTAATQTNRVPTTSRLTSDWQMPQDWHAYAAEKRFWKASEIADEAEAFKEHFLKTGQDYADWRMAWQGWVRRSNRPSGQKPFEGTFDQEAFYRRQIDALESQGRTNEANEARRNLEKLAGNVVKLRSVG